MYRLALLAALLGVACARDLRRRAARPVGPESAKAVEGAGHGGSPKKGAKGEEHIIPLTISATADSHGTPRNEWTKASELGASDLFIHCGDVADQGFLHEYQRVVHSYLTVPARTKLFIAGNHDFVLDKEFMMKHALKIDGHDQPGRHYPPGTPGYPPHGETKNWLLPPLRGSKEHVLREMAEARAVFSSPEALAAGVRYLEEGMHAVAVRMAHGKTIPLRVYASAYTPDFHDHAFAFDRGSAGAERYNSPGHAGYIPHQEGKWPHIVVVHGPPKGVLDWTSAPPLHFRAGSEGLLSAIKRVKPPLVLFGHIHEGAGAAAMPDKPGTIRVHWAEGTVINDAHGRLGNEINIPLGRISQNHNTHAATVFANVAQKSPDFRNLRPPRRFTMEFVMEGGPGAAAGGKKEGEEGEGKHSAQAEAKTLGGEAKAEGHKLAHQMSQLHLGEGHAVHKPIR